VLQLAAGTGALAALFGKSPFTMAYAQDHEQLPIGMNLAGIADWEQGFPFLNLMWGARVWLTKNISGHGPWDTEMAAKLDMDEDGYPLEVPFKPEGTSEAQYVFTLLPSTLKPGKYVILYDGEGKFGASIGTRIISAQPGRVEITMQHGGLDHIEELSIRQSVRGDHIRNIRILPIEDELADLEKNPFRPEFLEFCKPWHCLRFMDWLSTNASIDSSWAARKRRSFYTQVGTSGDVLGMFGPALPEWQRKWGSGLAIEICLQLANLTRTDAWLCVPHLADDEYIAEMAKLVKAQLDPSLKVYVEFSNEIWNWQFLQTHWMLKSELAGDLVAAAGANPPWEGGRKPEQFRNGIVIDGAGQGVDHPERTGALFRRCFRIWEEVFTGADRQRLIRACAVQSSWGDTINRTLNWVIKNGGCDVLSPAGYFGPDEETYKRWDAEGDKLTADDVIEDMRIAVTRHAAELVENAAYAEKAGVGLAIYEGGQHIQPEGQVEKAYNPALGAAQKHPAMYDLYRELLDHYAKAGCDLFCAFNSVGGQGSRWGSWGHIERYGQDPDEVPKYRAIVDANTPRAER
jgi:hypothetical protein